jgi:circadian clock protein KaiB
MSAPARYKFILYVADETENSVRAVANLSLLCRQYLPDRHDIEIVDVLKDPERALADGILMTPTLVKTAPGPLRRIVGTLNDLPSVLLALGLEKRTLAA